VTYSKSTVKLRRSLSKEHTDLSNTTITEMLKTQSVQWTANVTKAENWWSRKPEKESPEPVEDHKTKMYATNARRRVTGLTSAETKGEAEERTLHQDPDQTDPLTQEESPETTRERTTEEDLHLPQADLHPRIQDQRERTTEEESLPPTPAGQVLTAKRDPEVDVIPNQPETLKDREVGPNTRRNLRIQARSPMLQGTLSRSQMTEEPKLTGQEADQLRKSAETDLTHTLPRNLIK
jgi:hypothetical protein